MRQEGSETAQEPAQPQAFAFDGWSMVPLEAPRREQPMAEVRHAEPEALPA